jgi:hypothetical protein
MTKEEQLKAALEANGLSSDWDDWKDSQGLGQAVREVLQK